MNPTPNQNGNAALALVNSLTDDVREFRGEVRGELDNLWKSSREHGQQLAEVSTELAVANGQITELRQEVRAALQQPAPPDTPPKRGSITLPWWAALGLILAGAIAATPAALAAVVNWAASQAGQ